MKSYAFDNYINVSIKKACQLIKQHADPQKSLKSVWLLYPQSALWPDTLKLVYTDTEYFEIEFYPSRNNSEIPNTVDDYDPIADEWGKLLGTDEDDVSLGSWGTHNKPFYTFANQMIEWLLPQKLDKCNLDKRFFVEITEGEDFSPESRYAYKPPKLERIKQVLSSCSKEQIKKIAKLCFKTRVYQSWLESVASGNNELPVLASVSSKKKTTKKKASRAKQASSLKNKDLFKACKHGNLSLVKKCLESGISPNLRSSPLKSTPLMSAVDSGKLSIVKLLIKYGAKPNWSNYAGFTPLIRAVSEENIDIVKYLLKHGANPNQQITHDAIPSYGDTALMKAVMRKNSELVNLLLDAGAKSNIQTGHSKFTPLMAAITHKTNTIAKTLINAGADINAANKNNETALYLACEHNNITIARLLVKLGAEIETKNKQGRTPLHIAAEYGHIKIVELLLKHNAPVIIKNKFGETPADRIGNESNNAKAIKQLLLNASK